MTWIIVLAIVFTLSISLLIETSSWWIRSLSSGQDIGRYISRTNIYLYGGRFFSLVFASSISVLVDFDTDTTFIISILGVAFIVVGLLHAALLNATEFTQLYLRLITVLLRLSPKVVPLRKVTFDIRNDVLLYTAFSSLFFSFGLGFPYVLASVFSEFRLTISNLGQILNSVGTLLLLFFVDQRLFVSLDAGTLDTRVQHYSQGRTLGFLIAGLLFTIAAIWAHAAQLR